MAEERDGVVGDADGERVVADANDGDRRTLAERFALEHLEMVEAGALEHPGATLEHAGRDPHEPEHQREREAQPEQEQEGLTAHAVIPFPTSSVMRTA